jgi:hypothetical protein
LSDFRRPKFQEIGQLHSVPTRLSVRDLVV